MNELSPDLLKTKQHFDVLDGLRGIAAISIVTFHFMEIVYSDYSKNFIGHGFLAVDFFFCLSGFVIGYAYDDRIRKIGIIGFFKSRIIRLHPLVILGSVIGLAGFLFDPFIAQAGLYSPGKLLLLFLSSLLLIPCPVMPDRAFNLFGFNAPAWSLFWEYAANIVYAFVLYKLNRVVLILMTILSAAVLCFVCYRAGSLMGGWSGPTFWDGGARICFSFSAGLLVYRSKWIIKNNLGFTGIALLLFLAFITPFSKFNWLTEPLVVVVYFPLLIVLGAGAMVTGEPKKLCVFFGKISYPLYMTHYAALWVFANFLNSHKPGSIQLTFIIVSGVILLVSIAYLVMILYDIPVRRYWLSHSRKES